MAVVRMIKYDDLSILPVIFSGAELAGVRSDRLPCRSYDCLGTIILAMNDRQNAYLLSLGCEM